MPEVAICTENVVIPTLGAGMLVKGDLLEYATGVLRSAPLSLFEVAHPAASEECCSY
jgi:hypothetical protein